MVMDLRREGEEEARLMAKRLSTPSTPTDSKDGGDLADDIIRIIDFIKGIGEFRKTQRTECQNLVRRSKLFLPLLEEIRDIEKTRIPEAAISSLMKLKKAFLCAKKFLKLCHGGSKIYLALESETMLVRLHSVYDRMSAALEGLPLDELGISEEEKEQIELLKSQLTRVKQRSDSQDMELTMDLMLAVSTKDDESEDMASVERLANKLELCIPDDLKRETVAVKKLIKERKDRNAETTQHVSILLNKFKRLAGLPEVDLMDGPNTPQPSGKTKPVIPNEFLCPITLQIMTDPVSIASGQTYERESIQQWLDSNHQTCPKTGEALENFSLAPNFALKTLILQWCEKHNFKLPKEDNSAPEEAPSSDQKISSFVQSLSTTNLDDQRKAVKKIRMLSKESPENRTFTANAGGIPLLVNLLSYTDSRIQEHAVTALLNLSIDENNKKLISEEEEAIPAIIEILQKGTSVAKENSAAALFSLSMITENREKIGTLSGIPPLVDLLKTGTIRGKKDAMAALFNLSLCPLNKTQAIEAGIIPPLLQALDDENLEMVNETLSTLLVLASCPEGRKELGQLQFIEALVEIIRDGTPKNQECAAAVLLELGSNNSNLMLAALQYGVYEPLYDVSKNGTERGQRKADAILRQMSRSEQIP